MKNEIIFICDSNGFYQMYKSDQVFQNTYILIKKSMKVPSYFQKIKVNSKFYFFYVYKFKLTAYVDFVELIMKNKKYLTIQFRSVKKFHRRYQKYQFKNINA